MKTPSDELYQLVRSLTKSEKRYFRLYAERHVLGEKNNYLRLFEALEKLPSDAPYNEDALKKQLQDEKFVSYFPVAKQYLQSLVMDSLFAYNQSTSLDQQLYKQIRQAELLIQKGLISTSEKLLQKTKEKCLEHEKFALAFLAIRGEKQILAKRYYKGVSAKQIEALANQEREIMQKLENINQYWQLSARTYHYHYHRGQTRDEKDIELLEQIGDHDLLKDASKAQTYMALLDYNQINGLYHFLRGSVADAHQFNKRYVQLLEEHPEKMGEHAARYVTALNNFLIDSLTLKDFKTLEDGLAKMRDLPSRKGFDKIPNLKVDVFRLSSILELNMLIAKAKFGEAKARLPEIKKSLQEYEGQLVKQNLITFYYLIAYIEMATDNFDEALEWLNKIINDTDEDVSQDIFAFARILNLIVHYELNNLTLLEYLIKSTHRYLQRRQKLYLLEREFLKFVQKLSRQNIHNKEAMNALFAQLRQQLRPIMDDPYQKKALDYFDILSWLDSKISGCSFAEAATKNRAAIN